MTRERLQSVSTGNEDIYITKQKWKSRLFVIRKYLFLVCVIINRKFWSNFWTTNLLFEVWYLICSNELSWLLLAVVLWLIKILLWWIQLVYQYRQIGVKLSCHRNKTHHTISSSHFIAKYYLYLKLWPQIEWVSYIQVQIKGKVILQFYIMHTVFDKILW